MNVSVRKWFVLAGLIALLAIAGWSYRFASVDKVSPDTASIGNATVASPTMQTIEGTVSGDSQAIEGGNVCLHGATGQNRLEKSCALTDNNGLYTIALPVGDYTATASADGFVSVSHAVSLASVNRSNDKPQRLDFTLQPASPTLAGDVYDGAGRPIANASIAVYQDDMLVSNATTNERGHFTAWAPKGTVALAATATGYQDVRVQSYAPSADILVTMFSGFQVKGEVLLGHSRQPIANIRITATQDEAGNANVFDKSMLTDAKGRFAFEGLPLGKVVFAVSSNRLSGRAVATIAPQLQPESIKVLVNEAQELAGRLVVAPDDAPCSDGWLQLIPQEFIDSSNTLDVAKAFAIESSGDDAKPTAVVVTASKNGIVAHPAIVPGLYAALANCREHRLVSGPAQLEIGAATIPDQLWRFERGLSVVVHVVDENNIDIEGAAVTLKPLTSRPVSLAELQANPGAHAMRPGQTDAQGQYRFGHTQPGSYQVTAHGPGMMKSFQVMQAVAVEQGIDERKITLTLPVLGTIDIHAHTPANEPVSRLQFYAADSSGTRYDAKYVGDGRYTVKYLARGQYQVLAYDNKNPKQPVSGPAGEWVRVDGSQPVDLDFEYTAPNGVITGVVLDASGSPVVAAVQAVSATLDEDDERYASLQVARQGELYRTTDEQGRFRLDGLVPAASYQLFFESRGGSKTVQKDVMPGQFLQISLPALTSISGSVVTAAGEPVNEFILIAQNSKLGWQESRTFKAGTFKLNDVNPGSIDLIALTRDGQLQGTATVNLRADASNSDVHIVLDKPPADKD